MNNNHNEITRALMCFLQPGDVFEVRALDATVPGNRFPHTESGFFDYAHIEAVPHALDKVPAKGIYFTPNPVNPALLARAANRIKQAGKDESTSDADILLRRWLLIDCDPDRPAKISASGEEHALALAKAAEIKDNLASLGWPKPVMLDSGNGAQLMYRIDLPTADDGLIQACLKALSIVGNDEVKIDQTVHNPSRIWRLPGTWNRKGDEVEDRVYRQAHIISIPETLEIVPKEKLIELAESNIPASSELIDGRNTNTPSPFNLESWIAQYCPEAKGPEDWKDCRRWIFPVCPFNPAHDNSSAVITQQPNGAIGFKCHHNGCKGNDWFALRHLMEPEKPKAPEADISNLLKTVTVKEDEPEKGIIRPWHIVTNKDIEKVIENTILGEMCEVFRQVTVPRLPLEAGLLKSLVLAGSSLSGQAEHVDMNQPLYKLVRTGAPLARLCIDTAGGQVSNVYSILIGNPSSGKDIGRLLGHMVKMRNWQLPNRSSAEGLADALMEKCNGILSISEFQDWLNPNHWLNHGISFLTDSFDAGSFEYGLSSRGKTKKRFADYCYPSIFANIQPDIFDAAVKKSDVTSGFLGRFLFCNMPMFFGDPADFDLVQCLSCLDDCVEIFLRKCGNVKIPGNYLKHLSEMFKAHSPEKLHPHWRRLVLSYGPRFAVMLSVTRATAMQQNIILDERCWEGAEKLILWFFAHAAKALCDVEDDNPIRKDRERLYRKLFEIIRKKDEGGGVLTKTISQHGIWGTTGKERSEGLIELCERGILRFENSRYSIIHTPDSWK